jgi:hypothetical protein
MVVVGTVRVKKRFGENVIRRSGYVVPSVVGARFLRCSYADLGSRLRRL